MKIIELIIDEEQENGIDAISIVENPAIEENFIALNKKKEYKFEEVDKDKRILMGPLLIPNKAIYRKDDKEDYYIYFTKKTIRKASELFLKEGNQHNSTFEHLYKIDGLTLVESWIVEDKEKDKSALYGIDVPLGTWMGSVKVDNEEVWQDYVKSGIVKGFSIEGFFAEKEQEEQEEIEAGLKLLEIKQALIEHNLTNLIKYPIKALQNKVDEHNKKIKGAKSKKTTVGKLKKVYSRGMGAYKSNPQSVRPSVKSPEQWAMARVNSFLFALRNGKFRSGKHDQDLLPEGHPMSTKASSQEMAQSYNDYPEGAKSNAKRALKWAEKNGWGGCGTDVGKQRANQLAKGESITRDTIARMASFKRHQQHKDVPYSEGCGGLMWDAWGGDAGVNWAIRKLKQIDNA